MKKDILFIPYTYSMGGGSERVLREILEHIDVSKYNIDIKELARYNTGNEPYIQRSGIKWLNPLWIYDSRIKKFINMIGQYLITILPHLFWLKLPQKRYDFVIAFNYQIPSFACSICNGRKKITWIHSSVEDLNYTQFHGLTRIVRMIKYHAQRRALKRMDYIVAISDMTRDSIEKLFPEISFKILTIRNGSNLKLIRDKSKEVNVSKQHTFRLISCGRLDKNKNVSFLINLMAELVKHIDIELLVLGDGVERNNLETQTQELGLTDNITFIGYQQNPYPYIASSDLLCLSSYIEGSPVVVAESLALGVPFISAKVGGIKEFSNNNQAGIICNRTITDYQEQIMSILYDKEKYEDMKNAGTQLIRKYDILCQIKEIENIFDVY